MNIIITFAANAQGKDGKAPVRLRVRLHKRKFETTIFRIEPGYWDESRKRVRGPNARKMNLLLQKEQARMNEILVKYELAGAVLTIDMLKKEWANPSQALDFNAFLEVEVQKHSKDITPAVAAHHRVFLRAMRSFRASISFSEIDAYFVDEFRQWLEQERKLKRASVAGYLKKLKYYCTIAYRRSLLKDDPFEHVRIKMPKAQPVFLETSELERLIEIYKRNGIADETLTTAQRRALRAYLFCCFTGVRIGDAMRLTYDNIIAGKHLVYTPSKTRNSSGVVVRMKLPGPARKLMADARKEDADVLNANVIYFYKYDQTTRKYLQQLFDIAQIKRERISFHSSRHTFATQYLLRSKSALAFPTLSKLMGHSTVQQTLDTYVGITSAMLDEGMEVFNAFSL